MIAFLSGSLYLEYLTNVYFQDYVNSLSPVLVPVLSVAFGITSASIATYLYLGMRRIQTAQQPEIPTKRRAQARRAPHRPASIPSAQLKSSEPVQVTPPRPKPAPPLHVQVQKPPLKLREDPSTNAVTRKQSSHDQE